MKWIVRHVLFHHRDHKLKIVTLGAGDAHRVALDAGLNFELAVLDHLLDLLAEFLVYADLDRDHLLHLVTADFFGLCALQRTYVHIALGHFGDQHVIDLRDLEVIVGKNDQRLVGELNARVRPLEVETIGNFLVGLVDGVLESTWLTSETMSKLGMMVSSRLVFRRPPS